MSPVDRLRAAADGAHMACDRAWRQAWGVGMPELDAFIESLEDALRKAYALRVLKECQMAPGLPDGLPEDA